MEYKRITIEIILSKDEKLSGKDIKNQLLEDLDDIEVTAEVNVLSDESKEE